VRNAIESNRLFSGCERWAGVRYSGNSIRLSWASFDWECEKNAIGTLDEVSRYATRFHPVEQVDNADHRAT
jgi:hypothetical protein